ncbi:hypothetical protein QWZ13_04940 [Reinekea marina]|nr:hypothetical protein [Reinekea marina]MDN3648253.1 hypothetical protein [Reinekea marina]
MTLPAARSPQPKTLMLSYLQLEACSLQLITVQLKKPKNSPVTNAFDQYF